MKKCIAIILSILYLAYSGGVTVNTFYCCGKLAKTSFFNADASAKCPVKSGKKGCCESKSQIFKIKDSYSSAQKLIIGNNPNGFDVSYITPLDIFFSHSDTYRKLSFVDTREHAPPLNGSLYLVYRSLLI